MAHFHRAQLCTLRMGACQRLVGSFSSRGHSQRVLCSCIAISCEEKWIATRSACVLALFSSFMRTAVYTHAIPMDVMLAARVTQHSSACSCTRCSECFQMYLKEGESRNDSPRRDPLWSVMSPQKTTNPLLPYRHLVD